MSDEELIELPDFESDEIRKKVKLSYDGRQLMIRIPREIAEFYELQKGDVIEITVKIPADESIKIQDIPMRVSIIGGNE